MIQLTLAVNFSKSTEPWLSGAKETKQSYFERGCQKNVYAKIPKGNMGYDQSTVPNDCSFLTHF